MAETKAMQNFCRTVKEKDAAANEEELKRKRQTRERNVQHRVALEHQMAEAARRKRAVALMNEQELALNAPLLNQAHTVLGV